MRLQEPPPGGAVQRPAVLCQDMHKLIALVGVAGIGTTALIAVPANAERIGCAVGAAFLAALSQAPFLATPARIVRLPATIRSRG
jgi:hypothetical protein